MSGLPDELWRQILEIGIRNSKFSYKDLCCVSISCRRLHRLSSEDSLWSYLLFSDFPSPSQQQNPNSNHSSSTSPSAKSTYRIKFEREKDRKVAAHRRAVLRKESEIVERERKIREIETRLRLETENMTAASIELSNLHKVRQASVALNVWQPEVVRGRQKQIVEQCVVSVESRVHSLEMELKLCKQQIAGFNKAHRDEKRRLENAKEELASMKYHPLQDYRLTSSGDNECNKKRKKLKRC
ncbi:F-box protein SKIP24 [Hevea brasiliensis]|nr:F-box protein SKIP24 [Hevea brasiliensis]XP_021667904.2 F-box protein SKIP24 [Hevea brasiliensis]XP_021667905.2 F-box protein SKIP24 [Hevea brasiliensis]